MRATHAHPQADRAERTRHFVAALIIAAGYNALFALIHTLGANSPLGETFARLLDRGGFLAVGAVFLGAFVVGYQYKHGAPSGVTLLIAGVLTQAHMFFVVPQLLGWHGALYYAVDAIAVVVIAYDILLRVRRWNDERKAPMAEVVSLRSGVSRPHSHRAA